MSTQYTERNLEVLMTAHDRVPNLHIKEVYMTASIMNRKTYLLGQMNQQ